MSNPKGNTIIKHRFNDYITEAQRTGYVGYVLKHYKNDSRLAVWLGDHIFGKAVQPLDGDGNGGAIKLEITGMKIVKE